ncbi:hypothetical protein JW916_13415 [Candidatus Sumerlaeota bacterium]|nr:hypothetical protein [Candidatus Sumerlaeota bacterium]
MIRRDDARVVYVGGQGRVCAVSSHDGSVLWERELKKGGWFKIVNPFLSLVEDENVLYAFCSGQLFVLEKTTGKILVEGKPIEKLKHVPAVLAGDATGAAAAIAHLTQQQAAAASQTAAHAGIHHGGAH